MDDTVDMDAFNELFQRYLEFKKEPQIDWSHLGPPKEDAVILYDQIEAPRRDDKARIQALLNKLVIVKLNGGLGTSMGCTGPKSFIPVKEGLNFLDLTVLQVETMNKIYDTRVPLVLMDSFNTHKDTMKLVKKYSKRLLDIHVFIQSKFPRINKETLQPEHDEFYPPGHGDFYKSFHKSGLLKKFIDEGRTYCFVSNIDNLGATADLSIANFLGYSERPPHFVMEVTDKTMADVKGGTLIEYDGKLRLLEVAQVPKEHIDEFKSVKKFKIFNTNNLWIHLKSIYDLVNDTSKLNLEVIVNMKHLDSGVDVIQLETAAGAAMRYFDRAIGINVPRSRFLPVKKTADLLLIKSNLYRLSDGNLLTNPQRAFPSIPLVKLGDLHFSKVREFNERFASVPDVLELNHLTVSGDVTFGRDVSLRGTVIIIANHGERIDIAPGSILENKIVSGNLRILDH